MGLMDEIEDVVGDLTGGNRDNNQQGGILPASQDPYGDPGAQGILPASQDPYGDPGAQGIRPASEDPYGDPGR